MDYSNFMADWKEINTEGLASYSAKFIIIFLGSWKDNFSRLFFVTNGLLPTL